MKQQFSLLLQRKIKYLDKTSLFFEWRNLASANKQVLVTSKEIRKDKHNFHCKYSLPSLDTFIHSAK